MIHTLASNAFRGHLRPPKNVGISPIFRANLTVDGEKLRCYVKPLTDNIDCPLTGAQVTNQELVNEALGYSLARSCGLSVPDVAGVILLEAEQIPAQQVSQLQTLSRGVRQENYFCWFSKDMEYPNLKQHHLDGVNLKSLEQRRVRRLLKHLTECNDTPAVIAFDDWLMNSDRHVGNLLASPDGLMLIDHGRIFHYPNWAPGGVGTMPWPSVNRLRNLIDTHVPKWSSKLPTKSAMVMAYNAFAVSFRTQGEAAARVVLENFFGAVDTDAIIQLIQLQHDPAGYAKAAGMVV